MAGPKVEYLLWLDLETDGADERLNNILEVGAILTPTSGDTVLEEIECVVSPQNLGAFDSMPSVVREMHLKNGLLSELAHGAPHGRIDAEQRLVALLRDHGVRPHRIAMAGSGVSHFDARFIKQQMPTLWRYFKYWQLDMGHIRRFLDFSGFGYVLRPDDNFDDKEHRALADARLHLAEYRHYQQQFGRAFVALIEQTRERGMVVDSSFEPVESAPDERPEVRVPDVPEVRAWTSPPE